MSEQPRRLPKRHVLYRMRGAGGVLLYVGITANVDKRPRGHRSDKEWWNDIASIDLEHFPSRSALEEAERKAVRDENPLHNVIRFGEGLDRPPPPPPVSNETLQRAKDIEPDDGRGPKVVLDAGLWDAARRMGPITNYRSWQGLIHEYLRWFLGDWKEPLRRRSTSVSLTPHGIKTPRPGKRLKTARMPRIDEDLWLRFKQGAALVHSSPSVLIEAYLWWWMRTSNSVEPKRLADLLPDDLRD